MKKNINILIIIILLLTALFAGTIFNYFKDIYSSQAAKNNFDKNVDFSERGIHEDPSIYKSDDNVKLTNVYVTVIKASQGNTNIGVQGGVLTFDAMNSLAATMGSNTTLRMDAIFQEGDEFGPQKGMFGFTTSVANSTIEIRGQSTREAAQKSYQIKFFDGTGVWNEQNIINLNKHPWDLTRVRNKLSFDYFRMIPDLSSLRTRFVHVYIKDLSKGNSKAGFASYGLFTQVEQPNKTALSSHGLDPNGSLYRASNFEFYRYADVIMNQNDPGYNRDKFEEVLQIKSTRSHTKLISMLDDVNNYRLNINDIVAKHFDRDNMFTWLAVNILMGNIDTRTQNYMLYNPNNSDKWYFAQWDYDGAWDWPNQTGRTPKPNGLWENGIANYWGNVLFNRFLKDSDNQKQLSDKVIKISKIINKENTNRLLQSYYPTVSKLVSQSPDLGGLQGSLTDFETEFKRLEGVPEANLAKFKSSIESPMPIYLGLLSKTDGQYSLNWDPSYDFQGDDIKYDFQMAYDPAFTDIIINEPGLSANTYKFKNLTSGTYYWRVIVSDSKGNKQQSFDFYQDGFKNSYFGIKQLIVG